MNSLLSRALELQRMAHELMYLDTNGSPIYSDEFCRLNKEVLTRSDSLFSEQSSDIEEEGNLCLALLMGYNASIVRQNYPYWARNIMISSRTLLHTAPPVFILIG